MTPTSVDLLEQLRSALDDVDSLLAGRVVDIEMARLRVLVDPVQFRQQFATLVGSAVADAPSARAIDVRVSRIGTSARIEVRVETGADTSTDCVIGSMTVPIAAGESSAAGA